MRIPYEQLFDAYKIKWERVGSGEKKFAYAIITIEELWGIGHLVFKEPMEIKVFFGDTPNEEVLAVFNFGMEYRIPTAKEKNFLYNYAEKNENAEPIKTVFSTIKFDLMHAFFHYSGDPNYSHTHWALYGNLKDKIDADDSFITEDIEFEENKKRFTERKNYLKRIRSINHKNNGHK